MNDSSELLADENGEIELSFDNVLRLAVEHHRHNGFETAGRLYRQLYEVAPNHPTLLHFFGLLLHHEGHSERGVELIQQALEAVPDYVDAWNNLGNIFKESGHDDDAEAAYREVLKLQPDNLPVLNNLGALMLHEKRFDEAKAWFERALALNPNYVDCLLNLGKMYEAQRELGDALDIYFRVIELEPGNSNAYHHIGVAYYSMGRLEDARRAYEAWLKQDPDNPIALHMHAACGGDSVPERANDGFVKQLFDNFADQFDRKLGDLEYHAPERVAAALKAWAADDRRYDILDAGCGTGLCGPLIAPFAKSLVGVDLSAKMLAKANARGGYDQLIEAELTEWTEQQQAAFDLIVSADTFCYFGDLATLLAAMAGAMRASAALIFTVELHANGQENFVLPAHGRYAHSQAYICQVVGDAGLQLVSLENVTLRMECEQPVQGLLITATKD